MTKRIVVKQFAKDAKNNGVFGSLKSGNPEIAKNINDVQKLPAFLLGWEYAVTDGTLLPALEELQGVHALFAAALKQLNSFGIVPYDKDEEYFVDGIALDQTAPDYSLYRNKTGKNTGINPKDDPENWEKVNLQFKEVQNKLNRNFDNATMDIDIAPTFKNMSVKWGIPNYSAPIEINLKETSHGFTNIDTWTSPTDGIVIGRLNPASTSTAGVYINDMLIAGMIHLIFTMSIPVSKGITLTFKEIETDYNCKVYFFPFIGAE